MLVKKLQVSLLQKYGINGDKVGGIVSNEFLGFGLNATPLSVIPAKAG
jgi:hypothetical protein